MDGLLTRLRLARHRGRVRAGRGVVAGRGVRIEVAPGARVLLGDGCRLGDRTRILARGGLIEIGPGAVLGERCTLVAHAGVAVGERAVLAQGTLVVDFDHDFRDCERPVRLQGVRTAPVLIGARARLGLGASVLRGVRIGADAIVAPHAVVTADVPAGARAGGVPARAVSVSFL